MLNLNQIKTTVQFSELMNIPKEQSVSGLFDILTEEITGNASYIKALIEKLLILPYARLPIII